MQTWKKLGLLLCPQSPHEKLVSHAANPLPVWIEQDVYRVFYSGRDLMNRSSVGYADIDIVKRQVVEVCDSPVFANGPLGSYYDSGVSIGNCYRVDNDDFMTFMGWQCPPGGHWYGELGRLRVNDDLSLEMYDDTPFLRLNEEDPISLSYPWIRKADDGTYQMWYGSTIDWNSSNGEMIHAIKFATSHDGSTWERRGVSVPYEIGVAQAFSKPSVRVSSDRGYEMWFSYRGGSGTSYRIGYARSDDGRQFELDLQSSGIDVSDSGWDAEMIEYPFVFSHGGQWFMLYNGNGYGKSGFGLAVQEGEFG